MGEFRESKTRTLAGEYEDKSGNELGQGGLQGGGMGGLLRPADGDYYPLERHGGVNKTEELQWK